MDPYYNGEFNTSEKNPVETEQLLWFIPECAAAIGHRKHYYNIYHRKRCNRILAAFRTVLNHCKKVLENAKCSYGKAVQAKVENKQLGFCEFWKTSNQIMIRGKDLVSSHLCHIKQISLLQILLLA